MITRLALFGAVTAEALAIYAVNAWFAALYTEPHQEGISVFGILAASWIAFLVVPFLQRFEVAERTRSIATTAVTALAFLVILRLEFAGDIAIWNFGWAADFLSAPGQTLRDGGHAVVGLVFILLVWIRALVRAGDEIDLERLPNTLVAPFIVTTLVLILGSFTEEAGAIGVGAVAFYAVAVVSMTLSQLARSGATIGTIRAGGVVATLLGGTLVFSVIGVILAVLVWGPLHEPLGAGLSTFAETVLVAILTPPLWLLEKLFQLLIPEFNLPEPQELAQQSPAEGDPLGEENDDEGGVHPAVIFLGRAFLLLLGLGAVAGALAFYSRFVRRRRTTPGEGVAVSAAGGLGEDLRSLFRRGPRRASAAPAQQADDAARRLYASLLREGAARGHPRPAGATPIEYEPELRADFDPGVVGEITRTYDDVRYGSYPVDEALVASLDARLAEKRRREQQQGG